MATGECSSGQLWERVCAASLEAGEGLVADTLVDLVFESTLSAAFAPAADERKSGDECNTDQDAAGRNCVVDNVRVLGRQLSGSCRGVNRGRSMFHRGRGRVGGKNCRVRDERVGHRGGGKAGRRAQEQRRQDEDLPDLWLKRCREGP